MLFYFLGSRSVTRRAAEKETSKATLFSITNIAGIAIGGEGRVNAGVILNNIEKKHILSSHQSQKSVKNERNFYFSLFVLPAEFSYLDILL